MAANAKPDYQYMGPFNRTIFQTEFDSQFAKEGRYNAAAIPDMFILLGLIERDPDVCDIRWAAYMLATTLWETTSPGTALRQAKKKGKPLFDKYNNPVMLSVKGWFMTMHPVDEVGHGKKRDYHEAVKVAFLPDGSARVTEQDGDQFTVSASGKISATQKGTHLTHQVLIKGKKVTKTLEGGGILGTKDGGAAAALYDTDDGVDQAYFGRGYVQLTWWSNYSAAGVSIGRGLDLLRDPELVKTPEVAYALMSHGMRTGEGFANRHKLSQYFNASKTDYAHARSMVNGKDHRDAIAKIAIKFEAILMKAKFVAPTTP